METLLSAHRPTDKVISVKVAETPQDEPTAITTKKKHGLRAIFNVNRERDGLASAIARIFVS